MFNLLLQLDVVDEIWFPPVVMDTFFNPSGQPQPVSGLGFVPGDFGIGSLIAVSRNPIDAPPSYIFKYDIFFPGFPDPIVNVNIPVGELPLNMDAQGADVDSATGDLWIAADELGGPSRIPRLLRTDLTGAVLQTLTPLVDTPTLVRGLGFDGGAMFIAGRHLPTQTNNVYEIDRTTGAILRSFALPGPGTVGALTGGNVIPEPGAAVLAALAIVGMVARRHPSRPRSRRRPAAAPHRIQLPRAKACLPVRSKNPARRRRTARMAAVRPSSDREPCRTASGSGLRARRGPPST